MPKYENGQPLQVQDIAQVMVVGESGAELETGYGSRLTIYWNTGKPDPLPRVGEVWFIERFAVNRWRFVSRATSGSYNRLSYGIVVDATTATGKEMAIADDVAKGGFDSVYLVVGDNGLLAWDYDRAADLGLVAGASTLRRLMDRFDYLSVPVTLCIKSDLWGDVNNVRHNMYQQARMTEDGVVEYVPRFSFASAAAPISDMVEELFDRWGNQARGICFLGVGNYSPDCDFSSGMQSMYTGLTGKIPDYSLYSGDLDDQTWYEPHMRWYDAQAAAMNSFVEQIKARVGVWGISFVADRNHLGLTGERFGRARTAIPDYVARQGWSAVGAELAYARSSDSSGAMRSFEVAVALQRRMAGTKAPLPLIGLDDLGDFDGPFSLLAKYSIPEVIIDGYDQWRLRSDDEVIALSEAMNRWRVTEVKDGLSVGVALSSNTFMTAMWDAKNAGSLRQSLDECLSGAIDRVPHRIQFLFDDDLSDMPDGLACLMLFECVTMREADIGNVMEWRDSRPVIVVGQCGAYDMEMNKRSVMPFSPLFGENFVGMRDYLDELTMLGSHVDWWDTRYVLTGISSEGYIPYRGRYDATGMVDAPTGGLMEAPAPVEVDGRSSLFAIDIMGDEMLASVVGELVLYALGRV